MYRAEVQKFKEYAKQQAAELKTCDSGLRLASKCLEHTGKVGAMFNNETVKGLSKVVFNENVADKLAQVGNFAKLLGPAGYAVGATCDVLRIAGVILSDEKTLDTLSNQIDTLSVDLKNELKEMRALQKISGLYEYLLAAVETFEQNLPRKNEESFWERFSYIVYNKYKVHYTFSSMKWPSSPGFLVPRTLPVAFI